MSELGEAYREIKEQAQHEKWENATRSLELLAERGIPFEVVNNEQAHYRVGQYDFWATTGLFINRITKNKGKGVAGLIRLVLLRNKQNV